MTDQLAFNLAEFAVACQPSEMDDLRDMARLDGVPDALFALITSNPKKADIMADHDHIRQLMADGYSEKDICDATGLNRAALARRLRLGELVPELRALHTAGGLSNTHAEACAKLPEPVQRELARKAGEQDPPHLTSHDISDARRARAETAQAALDDALFVTGPVTDWRTVARNNIEHALQAIPEHQAAQVRQALVKALGDLEFYQRVETAFSVVKEVC